MATLGLLPTLLKNKTATNFGNANSTSPTLGVSVPKTVSPVPAATMAKITGPQFKLTPNPIVPNPALAATQTTTPAVMGVKADSPNNKVQVPTNGIKTVYAAENQNTGSNSQNTDTTNTNNNQSNGSNTGDTTGGTTTGAPATQPSLLATILEQIRQKSASGDMAVDKANQSLQDYMTQVGQKRADIIGTGADLNFKQGQLGALQSLSAIQQGALQTSVQNALTARGQSLNALGTAGNLASPIQVPYSNQVIDPTTGLPTNGGATGGIDDAVSTVAQKVSSGQMSYEQANAALSGYGQAGTNALLKALGPGFNPAQSNQLAGQQGQIVPAYNFAKTALTNLQTTFNGLGLAQKTGSPLVNGPVNYASLLSGMGAEKTRQYVQAVAEARNAYQALLAAAKGGTPTDYVAQSQSAIPDFPTANDINAAFSSLESLGKSKVDIFSNPGNQTKDNSTNNKSGAPAGFAWNPSK